MGGRLPAEQKLWNDRLSQECAAIGEDFGKQLGKRIGALIYHGIKASDGTQQQNASAGLGASGGTKARASRPRKASIAPQQS